MRLQKARLDAVTALSQRNLAWGYLKTDWKDEDIIRPILREEWKPYEKLCEIEMNLVNVITASLLFERHFVDNVN